MSASASPSGSRPTDQAPSGLDAPRIDPSRKFNVLSLFAGIGGFDLGLERTGGFRTVAFCEIDKKAQQVLRKHWPEVPIYDDVSALTAERLATDGVVVDCIAGGFPCQDISNAGKGAGLAGERSGLWSEYARLIGELEPRYVIVENVSALLGRGLGNVLGDLAALGYDAEWHCIPAAAIGAPHIRDRLWIIAYPQHTDANGIGSHRAQEHDWRSKSLDQQGCISGPLGKVLADTEVLFGNGRNYNRAGGGEGIGTLSKPRDGHSIRASGSGWWASEPAVGRVAHGVPGRVDRLKQLGNAVVPQIPELIGRAILAAEGA